MLVRIPGEDRMLGRIEAARRTGRPAETFDVSWREDIRCGMRVSEEANMSSKDSERKAMVPAEQPRAMGPMQSNDAPPRG